MVLKDLVEPEDIGDYRIHVTAIVSNIETNFEATYRQTFILTIYDEPEDITEDASLTDPEGVLEIDSGIDLENAPDDATENSPDDTSVDAPDDDTQDVTEGVPDWILAGNLDGTSYVWLSSKPI